MEEGAMQKLVATAQEAILPATVDIAAKIDGEDVNIPVFAVRGQHGESKLESAKPFIDAWRTRPERVKGVVSVQTVESFIEFIDRHKIEHESVVFAQTLTNSPSLMAVLNYHRADGVSDVEAGWADSRLNYAFPLSDEWKLWQGAASRTWSQAELAKLLQMNVHHLAACNDEEASLEGLFGAKFGSPAEIMTLSRGLSIYVSAESTEKIDPRTGEHTLVFAEEHKDAKGDKLFVPGLFVLQIPMFRGDPNSMQRIVAFLNYRRSQNDGISWSVKLFQADEKLRAAVLEAVAKVKKQTGLPVFEGSIS